VANGSRFGYAWLALTGALAIHVADEALNGFLDIYNPTVLSLRASLSWWPMPPFAFRNWLTGLCIAVIVLAFLASAAFKGRRWMAPLAFVFGGLMIVNAVGHTLGTIFGRTVESVRFSGAMPGFYSSPLLFVAAIWLIHEARQLRARP
jgi:hypothetical protein